MVPSHTRYNSSEKLLPAKTNLKPDNSCFENNANVYFLLEPDQAVGGHLV